MELEEERLRLMSHSRSILERCEILSVKDEELNSRMLSAEDVAIDLQASVFNFQDRREEANLRKQEADEKTRDVSYRGAELRVKQAELKDTSDRLALLEAEVTQEDAALSEDELKLLESRVSVEAELEHLRSSLVDVEARFSKLEQTFLCSRSALREVEAEEASLKGDGGLLDEIEAHVEFVTSAFNVKEKKLASEDADSRAQEGDSLEREASIFPEFHRGDDARSRAEERLRELQAKEGESEQQRIKLYERQRDLGCADIRLSGLEGALGIRPPDVEYDVEHASDCNDVFEMRIELDMLRLAESRWSDHIRDQQNSIQRLEKEIAEATLALFADPAVS